MKSLELRTRLAGGVREKLADGVKIKAPNLETRLSPAGRVPLDLGSSGLGEEGAKDALHLAEWSRLGSRSPPTGPLSALFVHSSVTVLGALGAVSSPPGAGGMPCPKLVARAESPAGSGRPSPDPPGFPGSSHRVLGSGCQGAAGWPGGVPPGWAGVARHLPAEGSRGAPHLLSRRRRQRASWRRRIHPDPLGEFRAWVVLQSARTELLHLCFIFLRGPSGLASSAPTPGWGWGEDRDIYVGGGGHRGQQSISMFPPGRLDLAGGMGRVGWGTDRERPPGTAPYRPAPPGPPSPRR